MFLRWWRQSLWHFRRTHVGVMAGAAICAIVLGGALLVGHSVKRSLREAALRRLGPYTLAVSRGGQRFSQALAGRLSGDMSTKPSLALDVAAVVLTENGAGQVNDARLVGVDEQMRKAMGISAGPTAGRGVWLGAPLAEALGVAVGDEVSLRSLLASGMPVEAPLAAREMRNTRRARLKVEAIVPRTQLGAFSLASNQVEPRNAFVRLDWLQEWLSEKGRISMILSGESAGNAERLQASLDAAWRLSDVGYRLREVAGTVLLESDAVYLGPALVEAALSTNIAAQGVLRSSTYLAERLQAPVGGEMTPYSFVLATDPSVHRSLTFVDAGLSSNEVVVSTWLAENMVLAPGDPLDVTVQRLVDGSRFEAVSRRFVVHSVVSMAALHRERAMGLAFPGLSDVEQCSDWDVGMPMDDEWLNDEQNEAYWRAYRDTPKAIFPFSAGVEMWGNRYGTVMQIRFAGIEDQAALEESILAAVGAADVGLVALPVREQALQAVARSIDLGGLFLGLSFFIIASALLLIGLLVGLSVEQRQREMGLFRSVGFGVSRCVRWTLAEFETVVLLGAALGALLAAPYARLLMWGLSTRWQGAVASASLRFYNSPVLCVVGALVTGLFALLVMLPLLRKRLKRDPVALLRGVGPREVVVCRRGGSLLLIALAALCGIGWMALLLKASGTEANDQTVILRFGAGTLFVIGAGLGFGAFALFGRLDRLRHSLLSVGAANGRRRAGQSMGVVLLLAMGLYVSLSVGGMQMDLSQGAERRSAGTGGFELIVTCGLPLPEDPASARGAERYRLDREGRLQGVKIVALRELAADDAGCRNLYRAQLPAVVGIPVEHFSTLEAFAGRPLWQKLNTAQADRPALLVGDADTAVWGLQAKAGTELDVGRAGVRGIVRGALPMRLSLFQGRVLMAERAFVQTFPGERGYRMLLVDVPEGRDVGAVKDVLRQRFERYGARVSGAVERLKAFYEVEATYLRMFLVLGGIGVLVGIAGLAVLIFRNLMERRVEFALLRAVGYKRRDIIRFVLAENLSLVLPGCLIGCGGALFVIIPSSLGASSLRPMLWISLAALLMGVVTSLSAAMLAARGGPASTLMEE